MWGKNLLCKIILINSIRPFNIIIVILSYYMLYLSVANRKKKYSYRIYRFIESNAILMAINYILLLL